MDSIDLLVEEMNIAKNLKETEKEVDLYFTQHLPLYLSGLKDSKLHSELKETQQILDAYRRMDESPMRDHLIEGAEKHIDAMLLEVGYRKKP